MESNTNFIKSMQFFSAFIFVYLLLSSVAAFHANPATRQTHTRIFVSSIDEFRHPHFHEFPSSSGGGSDTMDHAAGTQDIGRLVKDLQVLKARYERDVSLEQAEASNEMQESRMARFHEIAEMEEH
jgi:hypothetical protein